MGPKFPGSPGFDKTFKDKSASMKNIYVLKKIVFCLLFFLSFKSNALHSSSEIVINQAVKDKNNPFKGPADAIYKEKKYIMECRKRGDVKGEIKGCINMGKALRVLNRSNEALQFLRLAQKKLMHDRDPVLEANLYHVYGINYFLCGLHGRALESFNKALEVAKKIPDQNERQNINYAVYDWKRSCFSFLGKTDSVYSNERKCMESPMPMLYITIAERHFRKKNIDSAEYYINKANDLLVTKNISPEGKANVLRAYGRLSIEKRECDKSLPYLSESLAISQEHHFRKRTLETYKLLAAAYKCMSDISKENEYLLKYSQLSDSVRKSDMIALNTSVEDILATQQEVHTASKQKSYLLFICIILACVIAIFVLKEINKVKQKQKDHLINQKEIEMDILRKKLDDTYHEVVQLAIQSDPSFIHKFKETFSEFYTNLTTENPSLNTNDILLCALVKLNFSNKEIAEYTHVSLRTVESKKYRLKKKLGISAELDFNKWIAQY